MYMYVQLSPYILYTMQICSLRVYVSCIPAVMMMIMKLIDDTQRNSITILARYMVGEFLHRII